MKKSQKKNTKNYILIVLIVLLIALAVGYAAFTSQLIITGTATAKGSIDIHFDAPVITPGQNESTAYVDPNDSKKVIIEVNLTEPGDAESVTVDIVNSSNVNVRLDSLNIIANGDDDSVLVPNAQGIYTYGAIQMNLNAINLSTGSVLTAADSNGTITPNGSVSYRLDFLWPSSYTELNVNDKATFTLTFDYSQVN